MLDDASVGQCSWVAEAQMRRFCSGKPLFVSNALVPKQPADPNCARYSGTRHLVPMVNEQYQGIRDVKGCTNEPKTTQRKYFRNRMKF